MLGLAALTATRCPPKPSICIPGVFTRTRGGDAFEGGLFQHQQHQQQQHPHEQNQKSHDKNSDERVGALGLRKW